MRDSRLLLGLLRVEMEHDGGEVPTFEHQPTQSGAVVHALRGAQVGHADGGAPRSILPSTQTTECARPQMNVHPVDAWCAANSSICSPWETSSVANNGAAAPAPGTYRGRCQRTQGRDFGTCDAGLYCDLVGVCQRGAPGDACTPGLNECRADGAHYCYFGHCMRGERGDGCVAGADECARGLSCRSDGLRGFRCE